MEKERGNKEADVPHHSVWHTGRSAASLQRGVFLFSVHHEKGLYQEGFERRICDNMGAGVSPKNRHRHNGATEETRRLEEMCEP